MKTMKKKLILIILINCLFSLSSVNSQTLEEFERLSISEQLETMITVYGFDENAGRRLQFDQWYNIVIENPEELKPLLIEYLKEFSVVPYGHQDQRFLIMESILWGGFINNYNRLTDSDRAILLDIYQEKIDTYLGEFKLLDSTSIMLCNTARTLKQIFFIPPTMSYVEELLKMYKELGYRDISINYAELEYMGFK